MSNVIDLASRRAVMRPQTVRGDPDAIVATCIDEVMINWEKFARNNSLNDFFISSTPSWSMESFNYLSDLTTLASLEQHIPLDPQVAGPSFSGSIGWTASFKLNDIIVTTPPMPSEGYARCLNVLLYLKIKREFVKNNLITN